MLPNFNSKDLSLSGKHFDAKNNHAVLASFEQIKSQSLFRKSNNKQGIDKKQREK